MTTLPQGPQRNWRGVLDVIATLCIIGVSITMIFVLLWPRSTVPYAPGRSRTIQRTEPALPTQPIDITEAAVRGSTAAKVVIVEFADFACPYCRTFARDTFPELDRKYVQTGQLLFVFRHLPLETIHPSALLAAKYAECTRQQDRFWELHARLFALNGTLDDLSVKNAVRNVEVDPRRLQSCFDESALPRVKNDIAAAHALGVLGSPTFLLGLAQPDHRVRVLRRMSGAQPATQFVAAIDQLLTIALSPGAKNPSTTGSGL